MKFVIVLLAVVAVVVFSEDCRNNGDCHHHAITHCTNNSHVSCVQNVCTCYYHNDQQIACDGKTACEGNSVNLPCPDQDRHCIDGYCHCQKQQG